MYSYGPPHMAVQKQDDQHEHTFSSYVRIRDVVLKTYLGRWTIGRSGERGSGISVLPARYDDEDESNNLVRLLLLFLLFPLYINLFRFTRCQKCLLGVNLNFRDELLLILYIDSFGSISLFLSYFVRSKSHFLGKSQYPRY